MRMWGHAVMPHSALYGFKDTNEKDPTMTPPTHQTPQTSTLTAASCAEARPVGSICLNTVLGDLGAWLEETERHRRTNVQTRTVA